MKNNPSAARVKKPLPRLSISGFLLLAMFVMPLAADSQGGSPFDSGSLQCKTSSPSTIAKVTSLIAIVLGGFAFAHGEPGAKKTSALSSIREGAENNGYAVEGFAPTSRAAGQLRDAGIPADTLQGFLARVGMERNTGDPNARHLYLLEESSLAQNPVNDKAQPQTDTDLSHYAPIQTTLPNDAPAYDWKRETGDIQSYQHRETGGWLHIDPQGQFFDRHAQPLSREAALETTAHSVAPVTDKDAHNQSRASNSIDVGISI